MTDFEVDKLIVVTSAKKGGKGQLDQQMIDDGLALYQQELNEVSWQQQQQQHGTSGISSQERCKIGHDDVNDVTPAARHYQHVQHDCRSQHTDQYRSSW
jgi:hypothetical protein